MEFKYATFESLMIRPELKRKSCGNYTSFLFGLIWPSSFGARTFQLVCSPLLPPLKKFLQRVPSRIEMKQKLFEVTHPASRKVGLWKVIAVQSLTVAIFSAGCYKWAISVSFKLYAQHSTNLIESQSVTTGFYFSNQFFGLSVIFFRAITVITSYNLTSIRHWRLFQLVSSWLIWFTSVWL